MSVVKMCSCFAYIMWTAGVFYKAYSFAASNVWPGTSVWQLHARLMHSTDAKSASLVKSSVCVPLGKQHSVCVCVCVVCVCVCVCVTYRMSF